MKTVSIILSLLAVTAGAGIYYQHRTLTELRAETRRLGDARDATIRTRTPAGAMQTASGKEVVTEAEAALRALSLAGSPSNPQQETRLRDALRRLKPGEIAALILRVRSQADFAGEDGDRCLEICLRLLSGDSDGKALALLQTLPDFPGRDEALTWQFSEWSRRHPAEAVRWYEEESAKGNPVTGNQTVRTRATLSQFRVNPDKAVAMVLADPAPGMERVDTGFLSSRLPGELADPAEQGDCLAALRRAEAKSPGNPVLQSLRKNYLANLKSSLAGWTFEDATTLVDRELTPQERVAVAADMARFSQVDQPEKWADWYATAGAARRDESAIGTYMKSWAALDYAAAGKWLDHCPAGEAKDLSVRAYANRIAETFPEEAARRAATLPPGPEKEVTLQRICRIWAGKDPAAAAGFAVENGLGQ